MSYLQKCLEYLFMHMAALNFALVIFFTLISGRYLYFNYVKLCHDLFVYLIVLCLLVSSF
jgi:hypothetical protein